MAAFYHFLLFGQMILAAVFGVLSTTALLAMFGSAYVVTIPTTTCRTSRTSSKLCTSSGICRVSSTMTRVDAITNVEDDDKDKNEVYDEDIEFLFEQPEIKYDDLDAAEKAWRYAKKPLLRIGAKGATHSHGNSLRQLLDDHTVVKVKVNPRKFGTLENAFEALRDLAEENGAEPGIEMIQIREKDRIILFGAPGTMKRMKEGGFPPPPLPKPDSESESQT
jgi:RNA-binding protein YhbY